MAWPDLTTELTKRAEAITRPSASSPANAAWLTESIADALDSTKADVLSALAGRGFSPAQIELWASTVGRPLLLSIALYYTATDSRLDLKGSDEQRDSEPPAVLDRRPSLLTMFITDTAGNPVVPAAVGAQTPIGHGKMLVGRDEIFRDRDQTISGTQSRSRQWRPW